MFPPPNVPPAGTATASSPGMGVPRSPKADDQTAPSATVLLGKDTFEWKGFTYNLGPIAYDIRAAFEQRCETNECQGLERRAKDVSSLMYATLVDAYLDRLGSKHWNWNGLPSIQARLSWEGEKDLYFLILNYYNQPNTLPEGSPPMTREEIEEIWKDELKWGELKTKIRRLTDPNLEAQTPKEAGGA